MPTHVRHVLFYVPLKPGNLMLCEMGDGSLRILKDDEPLGTYRWNAAGMVEAVTTFQELKGRYLAGPDAAAGGMSDPAAHAPRH